MNFLARTLVGLSLFLIQTSTATVQEVNLRIGVAPRIADFKVNLHHFLEGSRIRKKRLPSEASPDNKIRVGSSPEESLPYLSDYNLSFWTSARHNGRSQVLVGTKEGHLLLFGQSEEDDKIGELLALTLEESVARKAIAFSHQDEQWFAVLQNSGNMSWIGFYQKIGRGLEKRQTINLGGHSDFSLITMKGVHFLAVATYRSIPNQNALVVYQWTRTQFDAIAWHSLSGVYSVACWILDGSLYLAVAQDMNKEANGVSSIYLFNAKAHNELMLLQMLSVTEPRKVLSFQVAGSQYIIFIGRQDAVIYWWSNDQFLLWQTIDGTAFAMDVSVMFLDAKEIVIVFVLKDEAMFLTLDASGHYVVTFRLSFAGHISSLGFMFSGKSYYALALFAASYNQRRQTIWRMILESYYLPSPSALDPLQQCLKDLDIVIGQRNFELHQAQKDSERVWLKDRDQRVTTEIVVTGEIYSGEITSVPEILILTEHKVLPDTSLPEAEVEVERLNTRRENIQDNIKYSVLKSSAQEITGSKYFQNFLLIPSLNLPSMIDVSINGILISRIDQFALKLLRDQTIPNSITISDVNSAILTMQTFNGHPMTDLLLLHGNQVVTGLLIFHDTGASGIHTVSVNSIITDSFVTDKDHQVILDMKNITILQSPYININGETNGVDLHSFITSLSTVNEEEQLRGPFGLEMTTYIQGDLFVTGFTNGGVSVSQLAQNSVKRHGNQEIRGPCMFASPQSVTKNLDVIGKINNLHTKQLLTLATDQTIKSNVDFMNLLIIGKDLVMGLVNNVDLDKFAVLKSADTQFISGGSTFVENLEADFVEMTEFVTLDTVDPSFLVQDIVNHQEGIVNQDGTVFHNVVVLGNVEAGESINGQNVTSLLETVWLKSQSQIIEVPVNIIQVSAKRDMEVTTVNKLSLETDLVHSFGNETIISVKSFQHQVDLVHNLDTMLGVQINGFDVVSIREEMEHYVEHNVIQGTKFMKDLVIHGDVSATIFNKENVNNLMRPDEWQEIAASIVFPTQLTLMLDDLKTNNVKFNQYNDVHPFNYFNGLASRNVTKYIAKNKVFSKLKATNFLLHGKGMLNSISFPDMIERIANLHSEQKLLQKTLVHSVDFPKPTSAYSVNGIPWSHLIGNIVYTDEFNTIFLLNEFTGHIHSDNIFVEAYVNGINITSMDEKAFVKSASNTLVNSLVFKRSIHIDKFEVTSEIDNVNWNDLILIYLDNTLRKVSLPAFTNLFENLMVNGLLNGCDLAQLHQKALYTTGKHQHISEEMSIQNIYVTGNLNMRSVVNEIAVENLQNQLITATGGQTISLELPLNVGFSVSNLNLESTINGLDFYYLMRDAVMHSLNKTIMGHKRFKDLQMNTLTAPNIYVSDSLMGINIISLYSNAVLKAYDQDITEEKIFSGLNSGYTTVNGELNGVSLPQDVVRTSTNEYISSPVHIMWDIIVPDVFVDGLLDKINISHLLEKSVMLTHQQIISSPLIFQQDVNLDGLTIIYEAVNYLALDLVCKQQQEYPLDGRKMFIGNDVFVLGSIASTYINTLDLNSMMKNVLRYNNVEYMKELQVFNKPFIVHSTLVTQWINGISIPSAFSNYFSTASRLYEALDNMSDMSYGFYKKISHQTQILGSQISRFAYFLLVQEINMGPIVKILSWYRLQSSFRELSHSLVIWSLQRHCVDSEKCCQREFSYFMSFKKSEKLIMDSPAQPGRLYPMQNLGPAASDKDFLIWTNTTDAQPWWCGVNFNEEMHFAKVTQTGELDFMLKIKHAPILSEVKTFRQGYLYAVAGFFYDKVEDEYSSTVVYAFNEQSLEWKEHQLLPSYGVLSLDLTSYHGEILLAVGSGMDTASEIYVWNDVEQEFESLQSLAVSYVTSILWLKQGSLQLLALSSVDYWQAKEDCQAFLSGGHIDIYIYEDKIKKIQNIPLKGVSSMVSFSTEGTTYLVAGSHQLQTLYIYEWRGYSMFVPIHSIFVGEVRHLNIFMINENTYMTVAVTSGSSKLLKVVLQGRHISLPAYEDHHIHEQGDQAMDESIKSRC